MSRITDGYILTITGWTDRSLNIRVDATSQSELTDHGDSFKVTFGAREDLLQAVFMPASILDLIAAPSTDEPEFIGVKFWAETLEQIEEEAYETFMIKLRSNLPEDASQEQIEEIERVGRDTAHSLITKVRAQEAYNAAIKAGDTKKVAAAPLN